jgi:uncharacterized membrane protein
MLCDAVCSCLDDDGDIIVLVGFVLFVFAVVGMQFYSARLLNKCFTIATGEVEAGEEICNPGYYKHQRGRDCPTDADGNITMVCARYWSNPGYGVTGFDNIGMAWLTVLVIVSMEGWAVILERVREQGSYWNESYFVLLIVFGSFFLVNLITTLIALRFAQAKALLVKRKEDLEEMKRLDELRKEKNASEHSVSLVGTPRLGRLLLSCRLVGTMFVLSQ